VTSVLFLRKNMDGTNQPAIPKKGPSKMLLVGIIVAIVAIAAIAGGLMLLNNNGTGNTNDNNNNNTGTAYELENGQFMVMDMNSSFGGMTFNSTTSWEVSNVTTTGYDVTLITYNSITQQTTTTSFHGDYNTTLGSSEDVSIEDMATKVGTEQLTTAFGAKTVDHYRNTTVDGTTTTVVDYYIGADTPVMYKMVMAITDTDDPTSNGTMTMVVTDTNIDAIRNGND
jgi:hypothetical protein